MTTLRTFFLALLVTVLLTAPAFGKKCKAVFGTGEQQVRLATGSPGELGMLQALAGVFNSHFDTSLCWKKAGSGASLKLLHEKDVDVVMVHAPAAEKKAVEEGWAINRTLLGSNEFYIVGPKDDPAGIADAKDAADAYARIAKSEAKFLSRGDNSGTHKKEMAIWEKAGVEPQGDWYITTKDFMMATLIKANDVSGYFMTDSSTWVAGKMNLDNIAVQFRGDPMLINVYHALCLPDNASSAQPMAKKFIEFVGSEEGQAVIRNYGKFPFGEPMYNDRKYAKKYDH